jgi:branched-chain amino acid transport system substrate-binding protein
MKKIYIILGVIVIVLIGVGVFNLNSDKSVSSNETIKIGAMLPMTGTAAIYGECQYNGALLAVEEANKAGGINGKKVELVLQDTKADVKEGVTAYSNIKGEVKTAVTAISGIVLAVGPLADKDQVVVMNIGAKSPKISQAGDYIFSTVQNSDSDEKVFAKFAKSNLGINNVALISVNNDYGLGASKAFADSFTAEGGKIVANEKYDASATDFRTILTKVKATKPEGVFIVGYKEQGLLLKQAADLGLKVQWLAPEPFASPDIIALAGPAADGVIYHMPNLDPKTNDEPAKSYFINYKKRFNKEADFCSANSYDGVKLFIKAISKVGNDGEKIKNWLYSAKNWESTTGKGTFDSNGDVTKDLTMMTVKNGQFVKFEK